MIKILVIDDDEVILRAVPRLLKKDTRFVCTMCTPLNALERISAGERFDIVLSDIMMEPFNGVELREKILTIAPELQKRYVFMTAYVDPDLQPKLVGYQVLDKFSLSQTIVPTLESVI